MNEQRDNRREGLTAEKKLDEALVRAGRGADSVAYAIDELGCGLAARARSAVERCQTHGAVRARQFPLFFSDVCRRRLVLAQARALVNVHGEWKQNLQGGSARGCGRRWPTREVGGGREGGQVCSEDAPRTQKRADPARSLHRASKLETH